MSDPHDRQGRHEMFDRHLRGELNQDEMERLAELLDSDPAARQDFVEYAQWDMRFTEVLRDRGGQDELTSEAPTRESNPARTTVSTNRAPAARVSRVILALATLAVVALITSLYVQRPVPDRHVARITGMSGTLQWTGDGGQIARDLDVRSELAGGTIEAMTPDSWFELEFNDGSTVAITGKSTLTFSQSGQKELHLKEGSLSCNVKPQPAGKPMLIHTRSAMLQVLGTQFKVEVGVSSTVLNVNQGTVRVKRLSDGSTVDVAAGQRVVAAVDRELSPVRAPDAVDRWKSRLRSGPDGTYGKWLPADDRNAARLKAIPMVPSDFPSDTLYMLALHVSRADSSPVILRPGSRFIVRGRLASSAQVYFGIKMAHPSGEFAGKFRADKKAGVLIGQRNFETVFELSDFEIDPCVRDRKDEFPGKPDGLVVTGVWCFTSRKVSGKTELEVTEVELIPPGAKASK